LIFAIRLSLAVVADAADAAPFASMSLRAPLLLMMRDRYFATLLMPAMRIFYFFRALPLYRCHR